MRVLELNGGFGLDHLHLAHRPDPVPGPGEVLVRMRAASLNHRDLLMIRGKYDPRQSLPLVPLSDGVGEVVGLGPHVTRVKLGDRVAPMFAQRWLAGEANRERLRTTLGGPLDGVLAELVCLSEQGVAHVPAALSDVEAATLPCAALTAWTGLVDQGRVRPGDTVLVQGTGGVSIFALQFAVMAGARVIATSSTPEKLERLRQLGAWQVLNYRDEPEWGRRAFALAGAGVDHVLEVGGAGTLAQSLRAVRPGGHISLIGVLGGATTDVNLLPIVMQNLRLHGVLVGNRDSFDAMTRAIALHGLRPVVDRVFAWTEARAALDHLASGNHVGKVCLQFG